MSMNNIYHRVLFLRVLQAELQPPEQKEIMNDTVWLLQFGLYGGAGAHECFFSTCQCRLFQGDSVIKHSVYQLTLRTASKSLVHIACSLYNSNEIMQISIRTLHGFEPKVGQQTPDLRPEYSEANQ
jgi:hypothetical protein